MALVYYTRTAESGVSGRTLKPVACARCGCRYWYELARIGTGKATAHYGIGAAGATRQAAASAGGDLSNRLATEAEPVPCPECRGINPELIDGYRLARYRRWEVPAFVVGVVGSVSSLVCAWFLSLGPMTDRWLLPYALYGGPAVCAAFAISLLLLRRALRSRIRFDRPAELPIGTPPALRLTGDSRLVVAGAGPSHDGGHLLDVQFGRHGFPAQCCRCLQPVSDGRGYGVAVTRLFTVVLPMCQACEEARQRQFSGTVSRLMLIGAVGIAAVALMMRQRAYEWWAILVAVLALFVAVVAISVIVASSRKPPVRVVKRDRSRGVMRLRCENAAFVQLAHAEAAAVMIPFDESGPGERQSVVS